LAYTIVLPELCEYIKDVTYKSEIPIIDIMGPTMTRFSQVLGEKPQLEPGLNRKIDQAYFERVACIDFAVRCDDGKDLRKLKKADIVVTGVSRTSKTPLSMYLAHQGYKAANVPLVPEVNPPQELYEVSSRKVVGLIIDPVTLKEIRKQRLKAMQFDKQADYAKVDRILQELSFAEKVMKRIGCMVINVTSKSIEETASEILSEKE
jgi:regulator of PEP synthase PpsR (kinase-PPPase family)